MRLVKQNHAVKNWIEYVTIFNYIDKILIVLSATSGGVSIFSFSSVIGAPKPYFNFFSKGRNS